MRSRRAARPFWVEDRWDLRAESDSRALTTCGEVGSEERRCERESEAVSMEAQNVVAVGGSTISAFIRNKVDG